MHKILNGIIVLVLLASCSTAPEQGAVQPASTQMSTPEQTTSPNSATSVDPILNNDAVVASGIVLPVQHTNLRFLIDGTVTELLVEEGDTVAAGTALARIDATNLTLGKRQAEVALEQARANEQLLTQGASEQQIAQAEAQVLLATAQLRQTEGTVSKQDIQAAEVQVSQAQAALDKLQGGPKRTDVVSAQATRDQATANLTTQRDALSAVKTKAELDVERAATILMQEQSRLTLANENAQLAQTADNEQQRQQARDGIAQAQASVRNAELALSQAQVTFATAQQAEKSGIQTAEAQLRDAEAQLQKLVSGADSAERLAAQAQLAQSKAQLARLTNQQRSGTVEAAAANVSVTEANLAALKAGPRAAELAIVRAQVLNAEVALQQAGAALDRATLYAPFAGTVVQSDLRLGEFANSQTGSMLLADLTSWKIETNDISELDIERVREGAPVTLTFEAIRDFSLPGRVTAIEGIGTNTNNNVTYTVAVTPEQSDKRIRWNMTASIMIEP